ncbi:MAG: TetR family transcriptional regulator [Anaeromyxobacter sp.]
MKTRRREPSPRRTDHRVRVGRARSSRTRSLLLEAALEVFAEKGPDAPVIDDFARAAGVSRGTVYSHFATVAALLAATSVWTVGSAVRAIDQAMARDLAPAARVSLGLRLFLARARAEPRWARFVARTWALGHLDPLRRDLRAGHAAGAFRYRRIDVALDVVTGALRQALFRLADGDVPAAYADEVVGLCLQALGVPPAVVARASREPLRDVPWVRPEA